MKIDGFVTETDKVRFTHFVLNRNVVLQPGNYMLCVFALWN